MDKRTEKIYQNINRLEDYYTDGRYTYLRLEPVDIEARIVAQTMWPPGVCVGSILARRLANALVQRAKKI